MKMRQKKMIKKRRSGKVKVEKKKTIENKENEKKKKR